MSVLNNFPDPITYSYSNYNYPSDLSYTRYGQTMAERYGPQIGILVYRCIHNSKINEFILRDMVRGSGLPVVNVTKYENETSDTQDIYIYFQDGSTYKISIDESVLLWGDYKGTKAEAKFFGKTIPMQIVPVEI